MLTVTYSQFHIKAPYSECRYAGCHCIVCLGPILLLDFQRNYNILYTLHSKHSRGCIFSHEQPFYEQAVSDPDPQESMPRPVQVTHSSFIEALHRTKNKALDDAKHMQNKLVPVLSQHCMFALSILVSLWTQCSVYVNMTAVTYATYLAAVSYSCKSFYKILRRLSPVVVIVL